MTGQSAPIVTDPDEKTLSYERMGDRFEEALSQYDTQRRVEVLVDRFLSDEMVAGKSALDVGCGLGFFAERLAQRGAQVVACDIGLGLVRRSSQRASCSGVVTDALRLTECFGSGSFDLVVSSECIEHTPDPEKALEELAGVVRPGGYLAVSTPNVIWYPVVRAATLLRLRPFTGYEHFSSWRSMRATLESADVEVLEQYGLHLFPFQAGLDRASRWCDEHLQGLRWAMINLCMLGRKVVHREARDG